MPAQHHIDTAAKLISIIWEGEATDLEFANALHQYQDEIRGSSEFDDYHEILDFGGIRGIKLTSKGLSQIAHMAAKSDKKNHRTKLAIVATSTVAFGFAKMYETYRRFTPRNRKTVRVFKNRNQALGWLKKE